eukprot:159251_1
MYMDNINQFISCITTQWEKSRTSVVANEVEEYHGGGGGKKKPCYVGWGAAAKSFTQNQNIVKMVKLKQVHLKTNVILDRREFYMLSISGSKYVGCTQDECNFESEEGRKCYQFGREYADGEVVDFINHQCEAWGAAQSK